MRKIKEISIKVLRLILTFVLIIFIIPMNIVASAEDDDPKDAIGSVVCLAQDIYVYMYKEAGSYSNGFDKDEFPEYLVIVDVAEQAWGTTTRIYYQLGMMDGSEHPILSTYSWILSTDVKIVEIPVNEEGMIEGQVGLVVDGKSVSEITVERGKKRYVSTSLGKLVVGTPTYQWQLLIDKENNRWADISGYCQPYANVSEALLINAFDEEGKATVRCIATVGENKYVSDNMTVTMVEPTADLDQGISYENGHIQGLPPLQSAVKPLKEPLQEPRAVDAFKVAVSYTYRHASAAPLSKIDGSIAAPAFAASLPIGGHYTGDVFSTPVIGYLPYVLEEQKKFILLGEGETIETIPSITYGDKKYYLAHALDFNEVTEETDIHVYYIPQEVNFMVKIYEQNLHNDEYVLAETVLESGLSDAAVGTGHDQPRTGFSALYYDPEIPINGEGTTEVEIYYDRNYYLVDFDLDPNDEGNDAYGATPYYVRYNTPVALPEPINPGYTFTGWTLDGVYNVKKIDDDEIEETKVTTPGILAGYDQKDANKLITVQHNVKYSANWSASKTSYTVIYWLENADSENAALKDNYSIWDMKTIESISGATTIAGADNIKNNVTGTLKTEVDRDYYFLSYNADLTDTDPQTVAADGTTTVNIFYSRKEYTLRFYYAKSMIINTVVTNNWGTRNETVEDKGYYIAGMTDQFAKQARTDDATKNDELKLMDTLQQWGKVEAKPTLKEGIDASKYVFGEDSSEVVEVTTTESGNWWDQTTTTTTTTTQNTYYYLSFKAKYGADIGSKWPIDVFGTATRTESNNNGWNQTAIMSAWTGEYNVKYQHDHSNQTIKGKYELLDNNLMWDPTYRGGTNGWNNPYVNGWNTDKNDGTISFLCFWENAYAGLGWNVPELYRYRIWLPTMAGQTYAETITHNGVRYYLADEYDTCDNSSVGEQTQPALTGFSANGYVEIPNGANEDKHIFNTDYNNSGRTTYITRADYNEIKNSATYKQQYARAYVVNYFYTRHQNSFIMDNNAGSTTTYTPISYGASLSGYNVDPVYPSSFEIGNYTFGGWFQDKACTIPFDFDISMPDKNVQAYAKWNECYYTAKVYLDSEKGVQLGETQTRVFNSQIVEPDYKAAQAGNEDYKNLIFAGWYYMDGATEKRFDFNTMVLKGNIEIYAKWTSHVPVDYTIYYVVQDDSGDLTYEGKKYKSIAEPIRGQSLAGITKSFTAKVQTELHDGFQKWYFPDKRTGSILMSDNEEENNYYFIYSTPESITYSVVHKFVSEDFVDKLGSNTLTMTHVETIGADDIQEHPAAITIAFRAYITAVNIKKAAIDQNSSLTEDELENIWSIVTGSSPDHYEQTLILEAYGTNEVVFNWKGTITISTYQVIHYFETDQTGHYVADYTQSFVGNIDDTATAAPIEYKGFALNETKSVKSGTITKLVFSASDVTGELVLKLYYDRETYNYTVYHYAYGTTKSLYDPETFSAKFGTVISVASKAKEEDDIPGYAIANESTQYEITDEGQSIVCYYKGLQVIYNYQVLGFAHGGSFSLAQAVALVGEIPERSVFTLSSGYVFKKWFYVIDGVEEDMPDSWKITVDGKTVIQPEEARVEWANKTVIIYAEVEPTRLTIQNSGQLSDPEQAIIYEVSDGNGNLLLTVAVVGPSGSVTILGLPKDVTYTITVKDDWSWEYGARSEEVEFNGDDTVTFEYKAGANSAITDDAYGA